MILLPQLANMPMFAGDKRLEMFRDGVWVGIFAPSQRQATTTYNRMRSRLQSRNAMVVLADPDFNLEFSTSNGQTVALTNGSFATAISASDNTNIEGESFKFIICEEAQDISDFKIRKCLTGDTKVLLEDGSYVEIEKLVKEKLKEKVVYFNKDFENRKSSVPLEYYNNDIQPVYELRLNNGDKIKATLNHQFLVFAKGDRKPQWKTVEQIIDRNSNSQYKYRMAVPDKIPYFSKEELYDYEKGLIMGYFLGDGCFTGEKPLFIGDELTVIRLLEVIQQVFGNNMTMNVNNYQKESGMYEVSYINKNRKNYKNNNPLTKWLREEKVWGLKGTEKSLREDKVYSKEFYIGLIEGLIETDGCIESYKVKPIISFANISEKLIMQLKDIYLKFGIHSTHFVRDNGTIGGYYSKDLHLLHIKSVLDIKRFAENITLYRKNVYLNEALETIKNKDSRNKSYKYPSSLRFYQITDIEYVGEEPTYCLKMPNRNFIANNMVSSNSIHPMGAAYNATVTKIGTATTHKGDFYEAIQRNKRDYESGRSRHKNHFEYDYKVVMKYNPKYKKYVGKEKYRLGELSDEFRMSYGLEWILERGMFIDVDFFEKMCGVKDLGRINYDREKNHVVGIDVAKTSDKTVVTVGEVDWDNPVLMEESKSENADVEDFIAYEVKVKDWYELSGNDYNEQYYMIMDYLKNFKISKVCIDATAEGSFADRLKANLPYEVVPVVFSTQSKSTMYKHLDREIKAGRVKFPMSDEVKKSREYKTFIKEFSELQKDYRGQHMVVFHPPERGAHDDYCFTENNKIMVVRDGKYQVVSIKDVKLNDKVLTHRNRWKPVTKLYKRKYSKDLVKIRVGYFGESISTLNHPFYTKDGFKLAEDINLNDYLLYAIDREETKLPEKIDLLPIFEELSLNSKKNNAGIDFSKITIKGDKIKFNNPKAKYHNRFVKVDKNLFRLLGYYLAEGSCGTHNVQFTFNSNEKEYLLDVKNLLIKVFGINAGGIGFRNSKNNATTVYTSSKVIKYFITNFIRGIAIEKVLPKFIVKAPLTLQKEFLKGYWRGDGYINSKVIGFTTTSETLAYQIRDMLLRFNIVCGIDINRRKGKKSIIKGREINHNADLYSVRIGYFKGYNKLSKLLDRNETKKPSKYHKPLAKITGNFVELKVKDITRYKEEDIKVYNLEVEEDHSYTILNSTVHNCDSFALMVYGAREESDLKEVDVKTENSFFKSDVKNYYKTRNRLTARRR